LRKESENGSGPVEVAVDASSSKKKRKETFVHAVVLNLAWSLS